MIAYIIDFSEKITLGSWLEFVIFILSVSVIYGIWLISKRRSFNGNREYCKRKLMTHFINYLFFIYTAFILMVTLTSRETDSDVGYRLTPFWSWVSIYNGNIRLLWECIWNVILFIPFGVLAGVVRQRTGLVFIENENRLIRVKTRFLPLKTFAAGFFLSAFIEVTQLVFHLGLFEWDDMIHNAIGSLLGGTIVWLI